MISFRKEEWGKEEIPWIRETADSRSLEEKKHRLLVQGFSDSWMPSFFDCRVCCILPVYSWILIFVLFLNQTNTVRVSNVSPKATEHDIQDFFSFSGEIEHIELHK